MKAVKAIAMKALKALRLCIYSKIVNNFRGHPTTNLL